jgi:DNA-directed RNA polymerase subunit L
LEIEVKSNSKNELEFVLKGERHTFPSLLRSALLKDPKVKFAAYKLRHPFDTSASFIVKTEGETPKKALAAALKRIEAELGEFKKEVKKSLR